MPFALRAEPHAATDFTRDIRPILSEFCFGCHSTEKQKGDLDLERFSSMEIVRRDPTAWEHSLEQIVSNEMPPKEKPRPAAEQMKAVTAWMQDTLDSIALESAGDPGPVVMRRLSNAEYTYTIRDITGVASLDPVKEFPVDGAAGEGFTNAGAALMMSPSLLTKYLDAAKNIAAHAVLLPDGIEFSPSTSSRDWTDEKLTKIREFYAAFSESGGATAVDLQGIKFDTNSGGRLPVEKYVATLLQASGDLRAGKKTVESIAQASGVNQKYLAKLWSALNDTKPSPVLNGIRELFRAAKPGEAAMVTRAIQDWQQSLWRFASVGHIGKQNGPKGWQEAIAPLAAQNEMRVKLTAPADGSDPIIYLSASDAGDGNEHDFALWENARLVIPGRADLLLRDVRAVSQQLVRRRDAVVSIVAKCLAAAAEAGTLTESTDVAKLAQKHGVEPELLSGWLDYMGIGSSNETKLGALLTKKSEGTPDYTFVKGWTGADALSVVANSSDATVRVPGEMKPHSVAAHPSPKLAAVIAWRSPVEGILRIEGTVQDAHTACGNGITWALELRRGHMHERLGTGVSEGGTVMSVGHFENVRVQPGDMVAMIIGPRDGNHVCDLTAVDLVIQDGTKKWNLADDVSPNSLAGNPHADSHGNKEVWHFSSEPESGPPAPAIPGGSLLAMWRTATDAVQKQLLAEALQRLLADGATKLSADSPDRALHTQLLSLNGPLLSTAMRPPGSQADDESPSVYGLNPALFGRHPRSGDVAPTSLCVQAPSLLAVRLPAGLIEKAELVVNGKLHPASGADGSVQMQVLTAKPKTETSISPSKTESTSVAGQWSDNNLRTTQNAPVIVNDGSAARRRFESAFEDFRQLFPAALCYTKIVPVDEVVTLTLFHREDQQLRRLMLDDAQSATLDRLWDDLRFVSEAPLKQVDVFEQLYQFATQDASPSAFEPMREPIMLQAAAFKKLSLDVEPTQVQAALDFAARAWRRPLTDAQQSDLRGLYQKLRQQDLPHAAAVRMMLTRALVAPAFLYRGEKAAPGIKAEPVSDWELATRLSYFLWASAPDDELRSLAHAGKLHDPAVLGEQTRRMMKDEKMRRLATEFGCQWLQVRDLEMLDEKSARHFPSFLTLRGAMQEEAVRFFTDLFLADRSVLSLLDADYSFINGALAKHYGIATKSNDWQRVDGLRDKGRGGILGFAATLAKQSGASRTSPILRGNWLTEVVLGEKMPRPPKGVPVLPEEAPQGLTERQLIERHSSDATCAVCHQRMDPFGFALEGFDAIGRARNKDAAGLIIDTRTSLRDGTELDGLDGLRSYLLKTRRDDFLRQFCRKLLGYALGRSIQLSDKPLLETVLTQLKASDCRVSTAIALIVQSPQFREVRGRDFVANH